MTTNDDEFFQCETCEEPMQPDEFVCTKCGAEYDEQGNLIEKPIPPNPYTRVEIVTVFGQSSLDPAGLPIPTEIQRRFLDCSTTSVASLLDEDGNCACQMRLIRIEPRVFTVAYPHDLHSPYLCLQHAKDTLKFHGPLWREGGEYSGSGPMITPSMIELLAYIGPPVPWISAAVMKRLGKKLRDERRYDKSSWSDAVRDPLPFHAPGFDAESGMKFWPYLSGILFIDAIQATDPGLGRVRATDASTIQYLWQQVFLIMGPSCFAVAMRKEAEGFSDDLLWYEGLEFGDKDDVIVFHPCDWAYEDIMTNVRAEVVWDSDHGRFVFDTSRQQMWGRQGGVKVPSPPAQSSGARFRRR